MCDTLVATPPATADGAVWFGKNSDREPGEAQIVEHLPAKSNLTATLECTHTKVPQVSSIFEVVLSRPFWMWGAEMGANEHGVAIGNEAVFTRIPVEQSGLTGMDLLRLALERATNAREAVAEITSLIEEHGQGGWCGYRHKRFRYHNSFIVADHTQAWVLETAGPFWAALRVNGVYTISNALSIGKEFDLISEDAYPFARSRGWCKSAKDFSFARSFGDRFYQALAGGVERSACTSNRLSGPKRKLSREDFFGALRDHAGLTPQAGWRMRMPCAHSSWWPARQAGQTTGSMVSRLHPSSAMHWLTGTSSPCLSVFKPVCLGGELISTGPEPGAGFDGESLFWRHERLHRAVLGDYEKRKAAFDDARLALEMKCLSLTSDDAGVFQSCWEEHRQSIPDWIAEVEKTANSFNRFSMFHRYWKKQDELDRAESLRR